MQAIVLYNVSTITILYARIVAVQLNTDTNLATQQEHGSDASTVYDSSVCIHVWYISMVAQSLF
jgi:hypothetical protein